METIPSPVYILILIGVWAFAGIRGGPFPLKLVSLYAAFFILCSITTYLVEQLIIPFSVHVITQCLLICALYDIAKEGRTVRAINRLCYALFGFMGLVFYSYALHLNYDNLFYQTQNILLNVHNLFSVILELYMVWILVEMIDGARGDPIYTRLLAIVLYGLSFFATNSQSFHYKENQRYR
jgi:hypothetical protein